MINDKVVEIWRVCWVVVGQAHLAYLMTAATLEHFVSVLGHVVNVDVAHFEWR